MRRDESINQRRPGHEEESDQRPEDTPESGRDAVVEQPHENKGRTGSKGECQDNPTAHNVRIFLGNRARYKRAATIAQMR